MPVAPSSNRNREHFMMRSAHGGIRTLNVVVLCPQGGVTIQRADEGWHGDVLGMPDMNYKDDDRASDRQRKILQPPSPEALLRAASRTLSGSLEVRCSDFRIRVLGEIDLVEWLKGAESI